MNDTYSADLERGVIYQGSIPQNYLWKIFPKEPSLFIPIHWSLACFGKYLMNRTGSVCEI